MLRFTVAWLAVLLLSIGAQATCPWPEKCDQTRIGEVNSRYLTDYELQLLYAADSLNIQSPHGPMPTYHLDQSAGSDANDGLTMASAVQTTGRLFEFASDDYDSVEGNYRCGIKFVLDGGDTWDATDALAGSVELDAGTAAGVGNDDHDRKWIFDPDCPNPNDLAFYVVTDDNTEATFDMESNCNGDAVSVQPLGTGDTDASDGIVVIENMTITNGDCDNFDVSHGTSGGDEKLVLFKPRTDTAHQSGANNDNSFTAHSTTRMLVISPRDSTHDAPNASSGAMFVLQDDSYVTILGGGATMTGDINSASSNTILNIQNNNTSVYDLNIQPTTPLTNPNYKTCTLQAGSISSTNLVAGGNWNLVRVHCDLDNTTDNNAIALNIRRTVSDAIANIYGLQVTTGQDNGVHANERQLVWTVTTAGTYTALFDALLIPHAGTSGQQNVRIEISGAGTAALTAGDSIAFGRGTSVEEHASNFLCVATDNDATCASGGGTSSATLAALASDLNTAAGRTVMTIDDANSDIEDHDIGVTTSTRTADAQCHPERACHDPIDLGGYRVVEWGVCWPGWIFANVIGRNPPEICGTVHGPTIPRAGY